MGKTDHIMYRYMHNRERFADLFNGILFQGKNIIFPDQLTETSGKYTAVSHRSVKRTHKRRISGLSRDITMLLQSGGVLRILAAENQNHVDYSMPLRCMEYDVLEYRRQLDELKSSNRSLKRYVTQEEYLCGIKSGDRLTPVYTICLYHGETVWDGPRTLADMMNFQDKSDIFRPLFADYPFRLFCVNAQSDFDMFHTELRLLFPVLNQRGNPDGLQYLLSENPAYKHLSADTLEALAILLGMPQIWKRRTEYKNQDKEDYNMCYAVQKWHEQDIALGRAEGIALGRREGIALGRDEGIALGRDEGSLDKTKQIVTNMLKRGFSDEDIASMAECDQIMIDEMRAALP